MPPRSRFVLQRTASSNPHPPPPAPPLLSSYPSPPPLDSNTAAPSTTIVPPPQASQPASITSGTEVGSTAPLFLAGPPVNSSDPDANEDAEEPLLSIQCQNKDDIADDDYGRYKRLLEEVKTPLYPASRFYPCCKVTVLGAVLDAIKMKVGQGLSDKSMEYG